MNHCLERIDHTQITAQITALVSHMHIRTYEVGNGVFIDTVPIPFPISLSMAATRDTYSLKVSLFTTSATRGFALFLSWREREGQVLWEQLREVGALTREQGGVDYDTYSG
ncbi:hypothetical protein SERLADRAFT_459928 [Serpula lacrymans var. lacrymans S7.9]|uniref:Uncharacterized protein n=1 Tax=Serpula lacrymans var. lacrymans (strain S7.9) TaxID=578457 RepID=F8NNQ3_SERL9|nr:uncharacterized protein SERLADRAFT_459928 [Serpula lacrymans var. lacrymans S7.9]EGO27095.1 hypothetical protein SERLADRAFT_459928 [Serpula lacrymans var. lacrymans S7.9]